MNLSFQLGIAYEKASQGEHVTEFNALVDKYNAWIRQYFGNDSNLFMQKINYTPPSDVPPETVITSPVEVSSEIIDNRSLPVSSGPSAVSQGYKNPFDPGSELSRFGKQQVRAYIND
jgi:hypothetical protein